MRVVGLTDLQSTAPNKMGNYVRENLEKGYIYIYIYIYIYTYLIILDLHLCSCTFDIVRADSSELKTPEMKEARLLEKSQERCQ
jgi:predicted nucleic acid-binding Zn finger protein